MDAFIGEIRIFGGDFAIKDWLFCQGQEIPVNGAPGLYAVISNTYGGTPGRTFKLPDLRNFIPVGADATQGSKYNIGNTGGAINYKLDYANLPAHTHTLYGTDRVPSTTDPTLAYTGSFPESRTNKPKYVAGGSPTPVTLDKNSLTIVGGDSPLAVANMQPFICMNFIICVEGIRPF